MFFTRHHAFQYPQPIIHPNQLLVYSKQSSDPNLAPKDHILTCKNFLILFLLSLLCTCFSQQLACLVVGDEKLIHKKTIFWFTREIFITQIYKCAQRVTLPILRCDSAIEACIVSREGTLIQRTQTSMITSVAVPCMRFIRRSSNPTPSKLHT